jgi:quercetin dioxygenase-like cupin family protein
VKLLKYADVQVKDLGNGVSRKVLVHTEEMMLVEVRFPTGGVGAMHSHVHRQLSYVQSGVFEFESEGNKQRVVAGDTLAFEPNQKHGVTCLQAGVVLDFFTPAREDFL